MWQDDWFWFDFFFVEQVFCGCFFFDGDVMGDFDFECCSVDDFVQEMGVVEECFGLVDLC